MILDANDLPDGTPQEADLCIVGAGAVGIAMALDLLDSGLRVLLLESGGVAPEAGSQALYAGTVADPALHSPLDTYRERRFGGSTTLWGGRSMPFDPIDFEARDYIAHSGWPIAFADLAPYYPRANRIAEAGAYAYRADQAFTRPLAPMIEGFASADLSTDTLERFSCPTDFGRRYRHKLEAAPDFRLLLHANVTGIALAADGGSVDHLQVATLAGRRFPVRARHVVLAAGGLENARLLLASRDVHPAGVGNGEDLVGRYYMCHMAGTIGALRFTRPVWHGYDIADDGTYCRRRIALIPEAQRRLRVGNVIARLHHPRIIDPAHRNGVLSMLYLARMFIPYEYAKRLDGEVRLDLPTQARHLWNVLADMPGTAAFMWHLLRDRRLAERKFPSIIIRSKANLYSLDVHGEQEPNPDSRLTLCGDIDALGMPRLKADWRHTRQDIASIAAMLEVLARDVAASGVGTFTYDPDSVAHEMTRYGAYGGHHIGTTRMAASPRQGVVDAQCTVHGLANLHLAGSSVFPTSGQANPTLTAVALGLRLADHLKTLAARPPVSVSTS